MPTAAVLPKPDRRPSRVACFYVTGDSLTGLARVRMREGAYNEALQLLVDGLEGLGYDRAIAILQGKSRLKGSSPHYVNNKLTKNTLGIEDDPNEGGAVTAYLADLRYPLERCVRNKGKWYEPYAYVTSYGREDAPDDLINLTTGANNGLGRRDKAKLCLLSQKRALHYADDAEADKAWIPSGKGATISHAVLLRLRETPPFWLGITVPEVEFDGEPEQRSPLPETLDLSDLEERGYTETYGQDLPAYTPPVYFRPDDASRKAARQQSEAEEAERAEAWKARDLGYHEAIRAQASGPLGGGFFTLTVEREEGSTKPTSYSVPRLPFYRNAQLLNMRFMEKALFDKAHAKLPIWEHVCPFSYKMQLDSQDHSDWLTGALPRITADDWYGGFGHLKDEPLHSAFYRACNVIAERRPDAPTRLSGRGVGRGMAFQPGADPAAVPPHVLEAVLSGRFVLVTPNADPVYTALALHPNCVGILTEVGGKLCHFAVIGREHGLRVMRVENACLRYPSGYDLTVDCDKITVEVSLG